MGQKQASSLLVRLLLRSFWSNSVCSLVKGLGSLVARFSSVAEAKSAQLSLSGIGFYGFRLTGYLCIFQHVSLVRPGLAQWLPHGLPILCCWESCIFEGCEPRADPSVVGDSWLPTITFFAALLTEEVPITLPLTSSGVCSNLVRAWGHLVLQYFLIQNVIFRAFPSMGFKHV